MICFKKKIQEVILMRRQVSLDEISDGKLYDANDLVKADCHGCDGCSACCRGMGNSIILDPLDVHRISEALGKGFDELLESALELQMVDGAILPNLRMAGETEVCVFLNGEGRCSIHSFRPGICRLFPLGRYYEDHGFRYFLQVHECPRTDRSKIKVKKWIQTPDLKRYEKYVTDWHYFLEDAEKLVTESLESENPRNLNLYILQNFYRKPYDSSRDFYQQFDQRLCEAKLLLQEMMRNDGKAKSL